MEKYIITLECNKTALAELIATGLERHATITKVEVAEEKPSIKLAAVAGSKTVSEPVSKPVFEGAFRGNPEVPMHRKQVTGWEVIRLRWTASILRRRSCLRTSHQSAGATV